MVTGRAVRAQLSNKHLWTDKRLTDLFYFNFVRVLTQSFKDWNLVFHNFQIYQSMELYMDRLKMIFAALPTVVSYPFSRKL